MEMTADTIGFAAVLAAVFAMLWRLHRDIEALRRDMGVSRQDMHRGIGGLRQDMHRGIGGLRQDIRDLCCRMSRVERMLAGASLTVNLDPAPGRSPGSVRVPGEACRPAS